jgi:hypothetical protein
MYCARREAEENGISRAMQTRFGCRSRIETDFCTDLGDRKAWASTGIVDSIAHELFHPAVAAYAGRAPIRLI